MLLLCSAFIRAHLEHHIGILYSIGSNLYLWGPLYKEGMYLLEQGQSRAMKMIRGVEEIFYEDRLREGLFSLKKRRPGEDLTVAFQYTKGAYKKD